MFFFILQVTDLRRGLNTIHSAANEVRGSAKLKRIMQTILSLGNALNHGTARGEHISITVRLPNTVFISKRDIGSIQEFEFASAFFFIYFFSFDRLSYRISPG
jgi:hypothetical protein